MDTNYLLAGAGLLAGAMNALAGGGSFVTLPALMATGVPPVVANASSSVALYPGGAASAWVYRKDIGPVAGVSLTQLAVISLLGGAIGSVLLLATPSTLFDRVLPWLLLVATLALAFGKRVASRLHGDEGGQGAGPKLIQSGQFLLGIYGGYFGGAVGIMMMAFWSVTTRTGLKRLQGPRTVLVTAANTAAIAIFAVMNAVRWHDVLLLAPSAIAGGYLGALLATRLPRRVVEAVTVTLAGAVTVAFFAKAYL
ncbi:MULTISPECIES: sulfite exporter TauE/SafE family protein [unclassified Novosphingobium]|uniref:sulfite exporter TauE/SafE family protein n=1 Tax=unclassified Novosphingobium TaxID=2644732 RepID=UPI00135A2852|nr:MULTISPECIES: sulfite exporter TauE/SafE family protein [unclassified Novosphingobium]